MWLRRANGTVDYASPFATNVGGIADMAFVNRISEPCISATSCSLSSGRDSIALYYTLTGGEVHKISRPRTAFVDPGPLAFVAVPPGTRVLDTRIATAGDKTVRANTTRYVPMGVDPAVTKAVLVNLAFVTPSTDGFLTASSGRTPIPFTSNVNAVAGEYVADAAVVPLDSSGGILVYSSSTADVVIDLLGYFNVAPAAVRAGRFIAVAPTRISDTRQPVSATNQYTRGVGSELPYVRVPVADRGGLPAVGAIGAAVLVVTAVTNAVDPPGFLSASAGGAPFSGSSHLNTNGHGDQRPNLVVVPVAADGTVDLHLFSISDTVVDVAGYFTSASAPLATAGRFHAIEPFREVDSRNPTRFFGRLPGGTTATINPALVPDDAAAMAQTITIVDNAIPGFVTPYPGGTLPVVSAGNTTAAGQIHAVLSFTQLSAAPATMSYYTLMATDLVVDTPGYFEGG
jgi:hypothetical protein